MKVVGIFDPTSIDYVEKMKEVTDGYAYKFSELLDINIFARNGIKI